MKPSHTHTEQIYSSIVLELEQVMILDHHSHWFYGNGNLSIFVVNQQTDEKLECLLYTLIIL